MTSSGYSIKTLERTRVLLYKSPQVPAQVFVSGGGDGSGVPQGGDQEVKTFLNIMTMDAAKRLNYDRGIPAPAQ